MENSIRNQDVIEERVLKAIRSTIEQFRTKPGFFFTESDLHSYFYHKLFELKSRELQVSKGDLDVYLVHREYPTNFRYTKATLVEENSVYRPESGQGDRGHYDIAVLNPNFVANQTIDHVTNKEVRHLICRRNDDIESTKREVLIGIEFKYMVRNSKNYAVEVEQDNRKLEIGMGCQMLHGINLVFCNDDFSRSGLVREATCAEKNGVISVFIQCKHDRAGKKDAPIDVAGNYKNWARWLQGRTEKEQPSWPT